MSNTVPAAAPAGGVPSAEERKLRPVAVPLPPDLIDVAPPSVDMRWPIIAGLLIILVAFGGVGSWAAFAPLQSAVVAPGTVVVESNVKSVQHLEGGIVKEVLVRDGDLVEAGQIVVRLQEVQAQASSSLVENQLWAALAQEARLMAERDDAKQVVFPDQLLERAVGNAEISAIVAAQERQFDERRKSLEGQVSILNARIGQNQQEIEGLKVQKASKERQVRIFAEELKGLRELFEKGYTPRTRILAMEREVAELEGEIGAAVSGIARAQKSIGEAKLQIEQTRQRFREEVVGQLRDVQVQVSDLREKLTVASDVLERTVIRAPQTGYVQKLSVHTVGGVIRPGEELMQVVPQDARLVIEAHLSPMDIDQVQVGQLAEARFSAFHTQDIPAIHGIVTVVSADRLTDERTGVPYYLSRVEVDDEELLKIGNRHLVPGMPADVVITTGERTALDYFLKPIEQFSMRAMKEE
ncbi:HlyD family type I secretion periplasmic adaptor subunit [Caenispirillum bisanense]|uniref:Membrane fusion protein (MFP) family protein n=1 Tax=Caenispirillum bisanense TaxID=414052 RepID=A0A286GT93_9PROT|nr:HlyD family type I secretion periplasmic adaptor subunit [Caenispirillum bisanense]SOD98765.1 HlyD family secretion protein/membrane fusion protein, epimerase transport system [Caenispirillum bisanense]